MIGPIEIYSGIERFALDSTAFLYCTAERHACKTERIYYTTDWKHTLLVKDLL